MEKSQSDKYEELYSKANDIYCRVLYPPSKMRGGSVVMSIEKSKQGFDLAFNQHNKIETVKYNEFGQIVGYGILLNPYTKEQIPDEDIRELNTAIKLFKEASDIFPYKGSPYKYIGRIYNHLGLFDRAIEYYKIAIGKWPQYKQELNGRIKDCKLAEKGKLSFNIETDRKLNVKTNKFRYVNKERF